jgi:Flp pilus assembly protein TadG
MALGVARFSPREGERGQSVVEFGLVVVVLLLLVAGIVDFGRLLNAWIVVGASAREAARQAAVGRSTAAVTATARSFALVPGLDPGTVTVALSYSASPPKAGDAVTVTVIAPQFEIVTPLVRLALGCADGSASCKVPVSGASTMRYEGAFLP